MRLRRHLARTVLGTAFSLVALALPLGLLAQATRLLPLLVAAADAPGSLQATAVLAAGGAALVAITLTPPVMAVAVALTLARLAADGGARTLASHGAGPAVIVSALRPVALVTALAVLAAGMGAEPPLAHAMRAAARDLAARGLSGTLARGGQIEPSPGVVLSAPGGLRGPLRAALVRSPGEAPVTVTAAGFTLATDSRRPGITLRDVRGTAPGARGVHVVLGTARVTVAPPDAPEDVVAGDLTVSLATAMATATTTPAPVRRHAARALWGVLAYAAVLWAAALGLRPRRSVARGIALAAVLPVAGVVAAARAGAALAALASTPGGIWARVGAVAVGVVALAELTGPGVARRRVRVL